MKSIISKIVIFAVLFILSYAANYAQTPPASNVYVAGMESVNGKWMATYWKNGKAVHLGEGYAYSVFVSRKDVYVLAGDTYWKNGKAVKFAGEVGKAVVQSEAIFVSGEDVYVAGSVSTENGEKATYWKNGNPITLTDGRTPAHVFSLFVAGKDVYVAGDDDMMVKYWKNGKAINLTKEQNISQAMSIFVSGNDAYVAGVIDGDMSTSKAVYWKNEKLTELGQGSANSIFIAGKDVYVAGNDANGALYWKNGKPVRLSYNKVQAAHSIFVLGKDVYVCGSNQNQAKYWKNGKNVNLTDGSYEARAISIFVTP
jgi:hypothetical protein